MDNLIIRPVTASDAAALSEIYAYYVEKTAISFEYNTPSPADFLMRIKDITAKYPYIVAEENGKLTGYAYAAVFKDRAAYDRCVEVTVYLAPEVRGNGIGNALYAELERRLRDMGILNLYACIAVTDFEDEYLTNTSRDFHAHLGYREIGTFRKCGRKFGRWYDMVWMEKFIGKHGDKPSDVKFGV